MNNKLVIVRGAGDIASGIAVRLHNAGFSVICTEVDHPMSIRRTVCFSKAVTHKIAAVEGITAVLSSSVEESLKACAEGKIAVIVDSECRVRTALKPAVVVDAILAKRNLGTRIDWAPIVVGVGPGFTAGKDCHAVIETMRGHFLGRVIYSGTAIPNTAVPGLIGGKAGERVLRAPKSGTFVTSHHIGDQVKQDEPLGHVIPCGEAQTTPATPQNTLYATLTGTLRGLITPLTTVSEGLKIGDIDPRPDSSEYWKTVSDKARAVGGGVLEAILHFQSQNP